MLKLQILLSGLWLICSASPVRRQAEADDRYSEWPTYDQLPLKSSYPTKAAWGVWGDDDAQGALNHITEATILAAAREEIRTGRAINLNLELDVPDPPVNPTRKPLSHLFQPEEGYTDDVLVMNTQIGTQYDGLRHFPYSDDGNTSTYRFYNDLIPSYEEVIGPSPSTVLGIQMAAQKGIAGRGVLLDYARWMDDQNKSIDAFTSQSFFAADLEAVAESQGLTGSWARPGDMLFVRTGWVRQYNALGKQEQQKLPYGPGTWIGMIANDESAEWLWNKKLALVGADNPAFESTPFNGTIDGSPRSLHQIFIGGWGQSILEFLDLERLSDELHAAGRSTFFLTVQTLNVVSGIASPPNAMAIL